MAFLKRLLTGGGVAPEGLMRRALCIGSVTGREVAVFATAEQFT